MGERATQTVQAEGQGPDPDRLLKKNVTAVHSTGLSLLQRKVFNALLLAAYDELLTREEHELPLSVLKVLIDYKSKDLEGLRQALREIRGKPVEFNLLTRDPGGTWTITGLLSEATIADGRCVFSFGKRMREMLYSPEVYVLLNLRIQNKLTSGYTLNLYENVSRFRGVKGTGFYEVAQWRKVLGAESKTYDEYKRFSSKVLAPAIKEINEKSDLLITLVEERRSGRGMPVARIKFTIEPNPQTSMAPFPVDAHLQLRDSPVYQQLREIGMSDRAALEAVANDPERASKIAEVVKAEHNRGRVKSPAAYALKLIRDNAELSPRQLELVGDKAPAKTAGPPTPVVASPDASADAAPGRIRRAFETARHQRAMSLLTTATRAEYLERWRVEMIAKDMTFILRDCNFNTGELGGMAEGAFQRFVTRELLGEATDSDLQTWIASRLAEK